MSQWTGCVLAGGQSSRMGQDKARLSWRGQTLVEQAIATLRAAGCAEVVISGDRMDLAEYAPFVADGTPRCGPLGGIEAVLAAFPQRALLCMAVDLPLLPVAFAGLLLERAERTGAWATVPMLGGRPQPLCAVYRGELLEGVRAALALGEYRVMRAIESAAAEARRDFFSMEALMAAQSSLGEVLPPHRWFTNVNTPDDWARLEAARVT